MTWLDITLIVFFVLCMAIGARVGSLWTAACLIGGFLGAFLVEYYALPLAEMIGGFMGAKYVASTLLFLGGVFLALVPGWILSKLAAAVFLKIFDSMFGLLTGFLSGFIALTLLFLLVLPRTPSVEKSQPWRKSKLVKPLHHGIEDFFSDSRFHKNSVTDQIKDDFMKDVSPALENTGKAISDTAGTIAHKFKKK